MLSIKKLLVREELIIFLTCALVYLSNGKTITSGDSVPNTLLAFNWLINDTLNFDNFKGSHFFDGVPYFFTGSKNGHLVPFYPIGPAIIAFPIYGLFYLILLVSHGFHNVAITSLAFEDQRLLFEKLASTIIASLAVVVFYSATRLKFNTPTALISTFIYAFATSAWTIGSQGLWQHGPTNLVLLSILLCVLKANRSEGKKRQILVLLIGILCGLLSGIRPTNLSFCVAIAAYSLYSYRKETIFLLLGLSSALLTFGWNLYYFGNLVGGYSQISDHYRFTLPSILNNFAQILVSPGKGLFVFSPILLITIPGIVRVTKLRGLKDERFLVCLFPCCLLLLLQYSCFIVWWAGNCYGPRFMTDVLPVLCFSINYVLADQIKLLSRVETRNWINARTTIFVIFLTFSTFVQAVGAFGRGAWEDIPISLANDPVLVESSYHSTPSYVSSAWRLWHLRDTQIERYLNGLWYQSFNPVKQPNYTASLKGSLLEVRDVNRHPLPSPMSVPRGAKVVLKATVQNLGLSQWLGYETSSFSGEMRVRVRVLDAKNHTVSDQRLYVSGRPRQYETATALGAIAFPKEPGNYKLLFDLVAEGVGETPDVQGHDLIERDAIVGN